MVCTNLQADKAPICLAFHHMTTAGAEFRAYKLGKASVEDPAALGTSGTVLQNTPAQPPTQPGALKQNLHPELTDHTQPARIPHPSPLGANTPNTLSSRLKHHPYTLRILLPPPAPCLPAWAASCLSSAISALTEAISSLNSCNSCNLSGDFPTLGSHFLGILMLELQHLGVYVGVPDVWKLPRGMGT